MNIEKKPGEIFIYYNGWNECFPAKVISYDGEKLIFQPLVDCGIFNLRFKYTEYQMSKCLSLNFLKPFILNTFNQLKDVVDFIKNTDKFQAEKVKVLQTCDWNNLKQEIILWKIFNYHETHFVVSNRRDDLYKQTLLFMSDENGNMLRWDQLKGSCNNEAKSHEEVIAEYLKSINKE